MPGRRYAGEGQPQVLDRAAAAHLAEQPHVVDGAVDEQVGDGVAVALEVAGEGGGRVADGRPAFAAGPCGAGEVQVRRQLVPGAGGSAAHADGGVGEGGHVGGLIGGVVRRAVAVEVVTDGVKLGQAGDLDEVVVVGVEVRAGIGWPGAAANSFSAVDDGCHLVLVERPVGDASIDVGRRGVPFHQRAVAVDGVGHVRHGGPSVGGYRVPSHCHLPEVGLQGGRRPLAQLVAELLPSGVGTGIGEVGLQGWILAGGAEVPSVRAPVGEGGGVAGGRLELRGGPALTVSRGVNIAVEVALLYGPGVLAGQSADVAGAAGRAGRVAVGYGPRVLAYQAAHLVVAGDRAGGVAVGYP